MLTKPALERHVRMLRPAAALQRQGPHTVLVGYCCLDIYCAFERVIAFIAVYGMYNTCRWWNGSIHPITMVVGFSRFGAEPVWYSSQAPRSASSCMTMSDRNIDLETTQIQPRSIPTDSPPPSPPITDATDSGVLLIYPCVRRVTTQWSTDLKVPRKREREVSLEPATPKSDVLVTLYVSVCELYLHAV